MRPPSRSPGKDDGLIRDCVTCPPLEGFERVCYPGQMVAEEELERMEKGVPSIDEVRRRFLTVLREHHITIREDILFQ